MSTEAKKTKQSPSRRSFLKSAIAASGAATAATLVTPSQASQADPVETEQKTERQGYHESPHIRQYYEKARF